MKVDKQLEIHAPAQRIWEALIDLERYADWNPYIQSAWGTAEPDAALRLKIFFQGESAFEREAVVTGFIPPRYFSFSWKHALGSWWLQAEQVFRVKESGDGKLVFYNEAYLTGLRLRFGRKSVDFAAKMSMERMNQALKERAEGAAG